MLRFDVTIEGEIPSAAKLEKQIKFGTAVGLTRTAQAAQKAIVDKLRDSFTLRNRWFEKGNRYGIKIKPAKVSTMEAQVYTLADWLQLHEGGGTKKPQNRFIAVPTENVRRSKKGIIRKAQRPRNLVNSFLVNTKKSGVGVLYQRKGKGRKSRMIPMYIMVPRAQIAKVGTFFEAAKQEIDAVQQRFIAQEVNKALANIKP